MKQGFSIVEVLIAIALFFIFSTGVVSLLAGGLNSNRQATEQAQALQYASEGLEAVRSIRNQSYQLLVTPTPGPGVTKSAGNVWTWNNSSDTWGKYQRTITVVNAQRDGHGNIVVSGEPDVNTKKVTSEVKWNIGPGKTNSVKLSTYLTRWSEPMDTSKVGGMAVFANGGTTGVGLAYRILNNVAGTWGALTTLPNVSAGVAKVVKLYGSVTRNEKVLVSKHISGTTEYLYAEVWNGSSWSAPTTLLNSPINTTYVDNRNYDATYLQNGDLMVVYGDNTTIPKMRIWNGSSWSAAINLPDIGGISVYVALRSRVGTDEVMAVFFDQSSHTNSTYYNGMGYSTADWSAVTQHATSAPTSIKEHVDFTWSQFNYMRGAMVYPSGNNDKNLYLKIWVSDGNGGGSWTSGAQSANVPGRLGPTVGRSNSKLEQYLSCTKDSNNGIYCYESDGTPTWLTPTNNVISGSSHNGAERSFDVGWKTISGDEAIIVYSDNSITPRFKVYDPAAHAFSSTIYGVGGNMLSTMVMTKVCQQNFGDDMMVLMSDINFNLYSVEWNGATGLMYTAPADPGGKVFQQISGSGSTSTSYWYDFAWDTYQ